ncbi:Chitin bind 4 domain containing protein, partial [Asbolus verrucosus]
FNFLRYQTDDIERREDGIFVTTKDEDGVITVHGSYSFTAPDGKLYQVNFVADENGYQP